MPDLPRVWPILEYVAGVTGAGAPGSASFQAASADRSEPRATILPFRSLAPLRTRPSKAGDPTSRLPFSPYQGQ